MYFIYMFMKNDYPLYIGKTNNLKRRIDNHVKSRKQYIKISDSVKFLRLDTQMEVDVLETLLIMKFKPRFNKSQISCFHFIGFTFDYKSLNFEDYSEFTVFNEVYDEIEKLKSENYLLKRKLKKYEKEEKQDKNYKKETVLTVEQIAKNHIEKREKELKEIKEKFENNKSFVCKKNQFIELFGNEKFEELFNVKLFRIFKASQILRFIGDNDDI